MSDDQVRGFALENSQLDSLDFDNLENNEVAYLLRFKPQELVGANYVVSLLKADKVSMEKEIGKLREEIVLLNNTIKTLEAELAARPPLPPPPPSPPIEVSPDITITLEGLGTFRPGLKGDRQGSETRYRGSLNDEIEVIIDIKDDGQIATCIERCNSHLPTSAPVIQTSLDVKVGSVRHYANEDELWPLRLHHHTRPRFILPDTESKPPKVDLNALISAGLIPNYNPSAKSSPVDIEKVVLGKYPWAQWWHKHPLSDPISENYGYITNSWNGGANEKMNEAHHIDPVQHMYLMTEDAGLWPEIVEVANSSGNYAIHYRLKDQLRYPRADETDSLPFLQGAAPVTLYTASGVKCPVPEPAHEHSLTYLAYLLTGERWYREELEAWCTYNLLTRPKNSAIARELRSKGIIWSGQVRASAWSLRALLHATLAAGHPSYGPLRLQLLANLSWMTDYFTNPNTSPEYRATGVCHIKPFRDAAPLDYVIQEPKPFCFATWNHHVLASVLNECVRAGFHEAVPMRDHVTKVIQGVWETHNPYLFGWGNHAYPSDSWQAIARVTFEGLETLPTSFPNITTLDYLAWARSAVVAAVDAKQPWATEALQWIDAEMPKYKGGVPAPWRIEPVAQ